MKININVLARPCPDHVVEFEQLVDLFDAAKWKAPDTPNPYTTTQKTGLFGLGKKKRVFDFEAASARFGDISEPHYADLGAPVVGQDPEADAWVRRAFVNKELAGKNEADALQKFAGLRVLDLLPVCDGFPVYSPSQWDKGYDRTAFYGTVLESCEPLIGKELVEHLYGPLLAPELAEWGAKLRLWADTFAQDHSLTAILGDRDFVSDDDPDVSLHIVDQMARWADFWSSRGYGSDPHFSFEDR